MTADLLYGEDQDEPGDWEEAPVEMWGESGPPRSRSLLGTWRRVGGGYRFVNLGELLELDGGGPGPPPPPPVTVSPLYAEAFRALPAPTRPPTRRELRLVAEILRAAEAEAGTDGRETTLNLVLRAYDRLLPAAGLSPATDTTVYRLLLKMALSPGADWWAKLRREGYRGRRAKSRGGSPGRGPRWPPPGDGSYAEWDHGDASHSHGGWAPVEPPAFYDISPRAAAAFRLLEASFCGWAAAARDASSSRARSAAAVESWVVALAFWERKSLRRAMATWQNRRRRLLRRAASHWAGRSLRMCLVSWRRRAATVASRVAGMRTVAEKRRLQAAFAVFRAGAADAAVARRAVRIAVAFWAGGTSRVAFAAWRNAVAIQRGMMRAAVRRWRAGAAFAAFWAWRSAAGNVARLREAEASVRAIHGSHLRSRATRLWRLAVGAKRQARDRLAWAIGHWQHQRAGAALSAWRDAAVVMRRRRAILAGAVAKWVGREMAAALAGWREATTARVARRAAVAAAVARWRHREVTKALAAWRANAGFLSQSRAMLLRSVGKWRLRQAGAAFLAWRESTTREAALRVAGTTAAAAASRMARRAVLSTWAHALSLARTVRRAGAAFARYGLARAFRSWVSVVEGRRAVRETAMRAGRKWRLMDVGRAWAAWRASVAAAGRRNDAAFRCLAAWVLRKLAAGFRGWRAAASVARDRRDRFWVIVGRVRHVALAAAFSRLREATVDAKFKRELAGKAAAHWRLVAAARGLSRWREALIEIRRLRKAAGHALAQWRRVGLRKAWRRWAAFVEERAALWASLRRAASHWARLGAARAWRQWRLVTDSAIAAAARLETASTLGRRCLLRRCVSLWRQGAETAGEWEASMLRSVGHWRLRPRARAFLAWRQSAAISGAARRLVALALGRWRHQRLAMAMGGWREAAAERAARKRIARHVVSIWCSRRAAVALYAWGRYVGAMRHRREVLSRVGPFAASLLRGGMARCLRAWGDAVGRMKRLRVLAQRVMGRLRGGLAASALAALRDNVGEKHAARARAARALGFFRARGAGAAMAKWRQAVAESAALRAKISRAIGFFGHAAAGRAFSSLRDNVARRHRARAAMARLGDRTRAKAFAAWASAVEARASDRAKAQRAALAMRSLFARRAMNGWRAAADARRATMGRVRATVAKWAKRDLSAALAAWSDFLARRRSARRALAFFAATGAARALHRWREAIAERCAQREVFARVAAKFRHATSSRALAKWRSLAIDEARLLRDKLGKAVSFFVSGRLRSGWEGWRAGVMVLSAQRHAVGAALGRLRHRAAAAAFGWWAEMVAVAKAKLAAASAAISRLRCRLASAAFGRWAEWAMEIKAAKAKAARAIGFFGHRRVAAAMGRWDEWVDERQALRLKLARAAGAFFSRRGAMALGRWVDYTHERAAARHRLAGALGHLRSASTAKALGRWHDATLAAAKHRSAARRAASFFRGRQSGAAFATWAEFSAGRRRLRDITSKAMSRLLHATTARAVGAWRDAVADAAESRAKMRRAAVTFANRCAAKALSAWLERLRLIHRARRAVMAGLQSTLSRSLAQWRSVIDMRADFESQSESLRRTALARLAHRGTAAAFASLAAHAALKRRLRAIGSRLMRRGLAAAMTAWVGHASRMRGVRAMATRALGTVQAACFGLWLAAIDETRDEVTAAVALNARIRHSGTVGAYGACLRVMSHWVHLVLGASFNAWADAHRSKLRGALLTAFALEHRYVSIQRWALGRYRARVTESRQCRRATDSYASGARRRGLAAWRGYAAARSGRRDFLAHCFGRSARYRLSRAFFRWAKTAAALAERRRLLRLALGRWTHRRVASAFLGWRWAAGARAELRRCARAAIAKWTHACVASALGRWAQYVTERRALRLRLRRALSHWTRSSLGLAFEAWAAYTAARHRLRDVTLTCLAHYARQLAARGLAAWGRGASEQRLYRYKVGRATTAWAHRATFGALASWRFLTTRAASRRVAAEEMRAVIAAKTVVAAFRAWAQEATVGGRHRRLLAHAASRWRHLALGAALAGWADAAVAGRRRRRAAKAVSRWHHRCRAKAWMRWREYALERGEMRARAMAVVARWRHRGLTQALNAWREWAAYRALARRRVALVLTKVLLGLRGRCLVAWYELCGAVSRQRAILVQRAGLVRQALAVGAETARRKRRWLLAAVFGEWQESVARELAARALRRWLLGKRAFSAWRSLAAEATAARRLRLAGAAAWGDAHGLESRFLRWRRWVGLCRRRRRLLRRALCVILAVEAGDALVAAFGRWRAAADTGVLRAAGETRAEARARRHHLGRLLETGFNSWKLAWAAWRAAGYHPASALVEIGGQAVMRGGGGDERDDPGAVRERQVARGAALVSIIKGWDNPHRSSRPFGAMHASPWESAPVPASEGDESGQEAPRSKSPAREALRALRAGVVGASHWHAASTLYPPPPPAAHLRFGGGVTPAPRLRAPGVRAARESSATPGPSLRPSFGGTDTRAGIEGGYDGGQSPAPRFRPSASARQGAAAPAAPPRAAAIAVAATPTRGAYGGHGRPSADDLMNEPPDGVAVVAAVPPAIHPARPSVMDVVETDEDALWAAAKVLAVAALAGRPAPPAPLAEFPGPSSVSEHVKTVWSLMAGRPLTLAALERLVRPARLAVFVSSTFVDTRAERDFWHARLWPDLEAECARLRLGFETVDLRFGVTDGSTDDHGTTDLCLAEIRRCAATSAGLACLFFSGERYGWRALPKRCPRAEMDAMLEKLTEAGVPAEALAVAARVRGGLGRDTPAASVIATIRAWYVLDTNARPEAVYELRNIAAAKADAAFAGGDFWGDANAGVSGAQDVITAALRPTVDPGWPPQGDEPWTRAEDFGLSVTHKEVRLAASACAGRLAVVTRTLTGLESAPAGGKDVKNYRQEAGTDDRRLLESLRAEAIAAVAAAGGELAVSHLWGDGRLDLSKPRDAEYVRGLSADLFARLCADATLAAAAASGKRLTPLESESAVHVALASRAAAAFVGRGGVRASALVLAMPGDGPSTPRVLWGGSGCGKTSLMAACAVDAAVSQSLPPGAVVLSRFCGATAASSTAAGVVRSLGGHIAAAYGLPPDPIADDAGGETSLSVLRPWLTGLLQSATADRPLLMFLDALDALSDVGQGRSQLGGWLPAALPPHASLVVATVGRVHGVSGVYGVNGVYGVSGGGGQGGDILPQLTAMGVSPTACLEVGPVPAAEVGDTLDALLSGLNRGVTPAQAESLRLAAGDAPTMLQLKLLAVEASHWRSWVAPPPQGPPHDASALVAGLCQRLEVSHGLRLVARVLGLLACSAGGLSQKALLDLLTGSDDVLGGKGAVGTVFQFSEPSGVRRCPPLVFTRLRVDLAEFVVERGGGAAGGEPVFWFSHSQFLEGAAARYLSGPGARDALLGMLADYFGGEMAARLPGRGLDCHKREADPGLPVPQLRTVPTHQALLQLPAALLQLQTGEAGRPKKLESVLCDLDATAAAIESSLGGHWLESLTAASALLPRSSDVADWRRWMQLETPQMRSSADVYASALSAPVGSAPAVAAAALVASPVRPLDDGGVWRLMACDLPTAWPPLRATMEGHAAGVTSVRWSPDGARLASSSNDGTGRLWQAATGDCGRVLAGPPGDVACVGWSPDGASVATAAADGSVRVWDATTGEVGRVFTGHETAATAVAWSPDGGTVASCSVDCTVRLWGASTGEVIRVLAGHTRRVASVCWSLDGTRLATASDDDSVRLWSAATSDCLRVLEGHGSMVTAVCWSPDGACVASSSWDKTVRVWDAATGDCLRVMEGHEREVTAVCWSPDGARLASGSNDCNVRVWQAATGECVRVLTGHTSGVTTVDWSPNGASIASAASSPFSMFGKKTDNTVRVWDAAAGPKLGDGLAPGEAGHSDRVTAAAWSPDGSMFATGSTDDTARVWSAATGDCTRVVQDADAAAGAAALGQLVGGTVAPPAAATAVWSKEERWVEAAGPLAARFPRPHRLRLAHGCAPDFAACSATGGRATLFVFLRYGQAIRYHL